MPKSSRLTRAPFGPNQEGTTKAFVQGLKRNPAYLLVLAIGTIGTTLFAYSSYRSDQQMKVTFWAFVVLVGLAFAVIVLMERGHRGQRAATQSEESISQFRDQIVGDWWEEITLIRRHDGSEEPNRESSRLSHVTIKPGDIPGHITMRAIGYNRQGEKAADWDSDVALLKGDKVFYLWSGRHTSKENPSGEREGFGQFTFVGDFAKGKFVDLDVGLQELSSAETKIVELTRCTADEAAVLSSHDPALIGKLVESKMLRSKTASA